MKYLVGVTVILGAAECASAFIEESMVGRKSSPFATNSPFTTNEWSPKSFAPKIRICPLGERTRKEDKINVDSNADAIIRREYSAWSIRHGKVKKDDKRYEIFKQNFVLQMEMNRKNGEFFLLNEFGDLTKEEYASMLKSSQRSKDKEQTEVETVEKFNPKVSARSATVLPPAPVQRLEDLTKDVIDSVMKSSRRSIVEEQKEVTAAEIINPKVSESATILTTYFDVLHAPMQPLDDFVLRPVLTSAAMTEVSETINIGKSHLVEEVEPGWGKYAYAMDFGDDEDCNYDYNYNCNYDHEYEYEYDYTILGHPE